MSGLRALLIVYIVRRVASKRKAALGKPPALAKAARSALAKPSLARASIATVALAVSIAASGLILDPRAEAAFDAPKRLVALLGIVVASITMLSGAQFTPPQWRHRAPSQIAILLLIVLAVCGAGLATLASPDRAVALDALRVSVLFALLLPLGASRLLDDSHQRVLVAVFIVASVVNAAAAILQALGLQPLPIESIAGRVSSVGLIGNEGYLGLVMALAAVTSLGVARFASSRRTRIACWGVLGLTLIALAATRNVTGWIALLGGAIALAWTPMMKFRIRPWPVAIAVAGVLITSAAMLPSKGRVAGLIIQVRTGEWDPMLSYRLGPWAAAVDMFHDRPLLGFGPGTFGAEFVPHRLHAEIYWARRFVNPQLASFYAQAHCDYLQALAELGIPAGLAAIGAITLLIIGLFRRLARGAPVAGNPSRAEAAVVLAMLIVGAIGALAWSPLHNPALAVPLLLAAGRGWRLLDDSR